MPVQLALQLAVMVVVPEQMDGLETESAGAGFTVTTPVAVVEQPLAVPVTV